jgi:hypothetical protein
MTEEELIAFRNSYKFRPVGTDILFNMLEPGDTFQHKEILKPYKVVFKEGNVMKYRKPCDWVTTVKSDGKLWNTIVEKL